MDKLVINGGKKLSGELAVTSAKNAFLPILAGSILCEGDVVLRKCPSFEDIISMRKILNTLGIKDVIEDGNLILKCKYASGYELPEQLTKLLRSSIFSLGSILSRFRKAKVAYPGGCAIGARPIDLHIKGLRELNVKVEEENGFLICDGKEMKASDVFLDFPSVGATENIMLACTLLKGKSRIFNPAKEPEIVDLQNFLNRMGAKITGAGSDIIEIEGVCRLSSVDYTPMPDRIITGTYIIACAMVGGDITLTNTKAENVESLIKKIHNKSCKIDVYGDTIRVLANGNPKSFGVVETKPYPDFPTDLQPQLVALGCVSKGESMVIENLFETRFKHVPELIKMGAKIEVEGKMAKIKGVKNLYGSQVFSADLRGGACLVLAGLKAKGTTVVHNAFHIDRGYQNIENDLCALGADIKREKWLNAKNWLFYLVLLVG